MKAQPRFQAMRTADDDGPVEIVFDGGSNCYHDGARYLHSSKIDPVWASKQEGKAAHPGFLDLSVRYSANQSNIHRTTNREPDVQFLPLHLCDPPFR